MAPHSERGAVVVLSGGQDSTSCLFWAKTQFRRVFAITYNYGQRHRRELESARHVACLAGVPHQIMNIPNILISSSPLTNMTREVKQYASADTLPGGIEKTFVPGRNALFLVLAANYAISRKCQAIVMGVGQEDFGGYPDCRESFIQAMQIALNEAMFGSPNGLTVYTPLMYMSKADTVRFSEQLEGCREAMAFSHTCYRGDSPPCGKCHACLLRARGYQEAGVIDPLLERLSQGKDS